MLLGTPAVRARLADALSTVPWIVFGAGGVLAWRFKRNTLVLALAVLALATVGGLVVRVGTAAHDALGILVALDLALLAWLSERSLFGSRSLVRLAALGGEIALVALLSLSAIAPIADAFSVQVVPALAPRVGALAQPTLLAFALALGAVAVRLGRAPRSEDAGILWAIVAAGLGLGATGDGLPTTWLSAAGLVLVVALVEASYGLAYGDELTGLPARRALEDELGQLGGRYAIAMVDVDHFKQFNDEHGHPVGDQLLRMVAANLAGVGGGGRAFRYGGEEFAIFFPGKGTPDVLPHLESLRQAIEAMAFVVRGPDRPRTRPERPRRGSGGRRRVHVTVSIGVAAAGRKTAEPRAVLDAADAALYRAKREGRNRVVCHEQVGHDR